MRHHNPRPYLTDAEAALLGAFRDLPLDWQDVLQRSICGLAEEYRNPPAPTYWLATSMQVSLAASAPYASDGNRAVYLIREEANPDDGARIAAYTVPLLRQPDVAAYLRAVKERSDAANTPGG